MCKRKLISLKNEVHSNEEIDSDPIEVQQLSLLNRESISANSLAM